MKKSILRKAFEECLHQHYFEVENGGSFALRQRGADLTIYFEPSNGARDWLNNFTFHAVPYQEMQPPWQCHAGFLKVWKSILPYMENKLADTNIRSVRMIGYSHGAALAVLCHEYVWFHRPDLRKHLLGLGFGCPRVLYQCVPLAVSRRWENFYVIRNADDIVTHLPPSIFGYCHVGNLVTVGTAGTYNGVDAHRPESYLREL